METAVIGGGGESCDVDVSLSAKPDNLLQSDSSDECSLCVCVRACVYVQIYEYVYTQCARACLYMSFALCVGVCLLFVGVYFNLKISKEGLPAAQ